MQIGDKKKNYIPLILLFLPILIFFFPILSQGKLPIPADTIVGMYHPFRDVVWKDFTAGVPFKNFLITDAVRQQYPWRELAVSLVKRGEFPSWNPYTFAGTPLAANIQTALFYPFNLLFFIFNFPTAWTIQIVSQWVLLSIFTFYYLQEIGRSKKSSILAAIVLTFSGFSVAWLEWNTTLHSLVWLPMALLSIEKLCKEWRWKWAILLIFSLASILFSGFLQTTIYAYLLLTVYLAYKLSTIQKEDKIKRNIALKFLLVGLITVVITSIQWFPTAKLISHSARSIDQGNVLERQDWFIPWQHLVQFIAPDFFGNPATLNYWGIFNYLEFVGYIGIFPLILLLLSLFPKKDSIFKKRRFFIIALFLSLLFSTPNPLAKLPFWLSLPLVSTAQPSRLLFIINFSMAVLVAYGIDYFFQGFFNKNKVFNKRFTAVIAILSIFLGFLWLVVSQG
jgi:hypothetical protein